LKNKIVCVSGAPLVGKSSILVIVIRILHAMGLFKWLNIDNESAFSRELRALCAKKSGMVLNSPEFVGAFNLRGQLDFQALCRATASQGFNVLMGGPFEDLTGMVGEQQLLNKMVSDFGEFDLIFIQLLLVPKGVEITSKNVMEHPEMLPIEAEMQRRREERSVKGEAQIALDSDKTAPDYYRQRLKKQLITAETFPDQVHQVKLHLDDTPEQAAQKFVEVLLKVAA
jgi:hypothetical protein